MQEQPPIQKNYFKSLLSIWYFFLVKSGMEITWSPSPENVELFYICFHLYCDNFHLHPLIPTNQSCLVCSFFNSILLLKATAKISDFGYKSIFNLFVAHTLHSSTSSFLVSEFIYMAEEFFF